MYSISTYCYANQQAQRVYELARLLLLLFSLLDKSGPSHTLSKSIILSYGHHWPFKKKKKSYGHHWAKNGLPSGHHLKWNGRVIIMILIFFLKVKVLSHTLMIFLFFPLHYEYGMEATSTLLSLSVNGII